MSTGYLLDTHVFVRWARDSRKLSRAQLRVMREAERRVEPFSLSAMSLLELSILASGSRSRTALQAHDLFALLQTSPCYDILPITVAVAQEYAALVGAIADPGDRAIVATARVHGLTLITSDQRIIDSKLVRVVD